MSEVVETAAVMPTPRKGQRASVVFVLIMLGIDAFGVGVVIPVVPTLVRQLSDHAAGGHAIARASLWVALLVSAYAFAQVLAAPALGGLSDRFGRRPVILGSVCGICLNYILLAVAPSLGWLLVGRLLAGATAANTSAGAAYIADVTPPELRAQRFGLIGATFGLGFVLGPAIGGLIGGYAIRGPFILAAVMSGMNAAFGIFVLPESLAPENRRPFEWARANPVGSIEFVLRDSFVTRLAAAWSGLWCGVCVLQSTFVLYTALRFQWGPVANGLALALVGVSQAVVQGLLVRRVIARLGEPRTAMLGCLLGFVSFALISVALHPWVVYLAIIIMAASSITQPSVRSMLSVRVGPRHQGEIQGALSSVEGLTQIVMPLVAGGLFAWFSAASAPVRYPGAPLMLGALMFLLSLVCIRGATRSVRLAVPG